MRTNYKDMCKPLTTDESNMNDHVVTPDVPKPKPVKGTVINCLKLNIRQFADITSRSVWVLPVDSEVTVYLDKSTEDWVNVRTKSGVTGFCMREYIFINS